MRMFAERPKATQQSTSVRFALPRRGHSRESTTTAAARFGHDFSQIAVFAATPARADPVAASEKSVEGGEQNFIDDLLVERAPAESDGDAGPAPPAPPAPAPPAPAPPAPAPPAKAKKAGVDSFKVKWSKHAGAGAADAKLRLDYTAKFKKDADHDPALAEFRQSVMSTWDITAGPHKGRKGTTSPMHDDNYSRADDQAGNAITDVNFYSNDNPGYDDLDKDDVLDYSFTAEQTVIDTSQANKVIAKRGPHTATVKGKDPRTYTGVPTTLS